MKKLRTVTFIVAFLVLVVIIVGQFASNRLKRVEVTPSSPTPLEAMEPEKEIINLVIDTGDGNVYRYEKDLEEGDDAYLLLETYIAHSGLEFSTTEYDSGVFVESIDNHANSEDQSWIYFVNGTSGNVASSEYKLVPGDVVEWKYIKPDPSI